MKEGTDTGFLNGAFGVFSFTLQNAKKSRTCSSVTSGAAKKEYKQRRNTAKEDDVQVTEQCPSLQHREHNKSCCNTLLVSHNSKVRDCSINLLIHRHYRDCAVSFLERKSAQMKVAHFIRQTDADENNLPSFGV